MIQSINQFLVQNNYNLSSFFGHTTIIQTIFNLPRFALFKVYELFTKIKQKRLKKKLIITKQNNKKTHNGIKMTILIKKQRVWFYEVFCRNTRQYER